MAIQILSRIFALLLAGLSMAGAAELEIVIGTGDELAIDVYNEKDLSVRAAVPKSGQLRIPLLGDITVVGKTPAQLTKELEAAYLDGYLVSPSVSVVIESFRPFYIRGAVKSSGAYKFELDLTVDQAVAVAGGLKDRASKSNWYIIREPDKKRTKVSKDTLVLPGDIIEIEESIF